MSHEKLKSVGFISKEENREGLLSAGELDARYLKLLRMHGEEEMAEYYGMRRRFSSPYYEALQLEDLDITTNVDLCDSLELKYSQQAELEDGSGGTSRAKRGPSVKLGGVSRKILEPEGPKREQPHQMKKFKKESDVGVIKSEGSSMADIYATVNHEAFVENAMKDFFLYVIFLIITNMITFGVLDHAYNYYANVLAELITDTEFPTSLGASKTFKEIRSVDQIWDFIQGLLITVLYEYGSDYTRSISLSKESDALIIFETLLIGVPRIRQQRVRNDSCKTEQFFQDLFPTCYTYYSDDWEDKEPFGNKMPNAWTYSEPDRDSASYHGKISSYGGGGYMVNITNDREYTTNWIKELIQDQWITQGTRVVFIDFTTYTPNTNLFCVVKLVFELPPTGGVIPTSHFYTMKFLRYVNTWDHFVLGCEIVFLCFVVYFSMEELQQMKHLKEEYWYSMWNILDIIILTVSYVVVITGCVRYVTVASGMNEKVSHIAAGSHASFDNFVRVQRTFNTSAALLSFLVWLKLLKFAALNKSVALILSIFGRVKFELIALTLMMFTMVVGFALLGNMLFGTYVEQFNTIWNSVFSLVGVFVGGLYFYSSCANASPTLAPIFFILYIFIVLVLFLNAYVALIVHGFHKAVEEFDDQRDRVFLGDICRAVMYRTLKLFRRKNLANKIRNRKLANENKKDYEDLLTIVKKHGFRGLDITMLLKKHNITAGAPIPFERMGQLYNEIDAKNQLMLEVDEHDKIMDQVDSIITKVEMLDKSTADIMVKVGTLVNRLLYTDDKANNR